MIGVSQCGIAVLDEAMYTRVGSTDFVAMSVVDCSSLNIKYSGFY